MLKLGTCITATLCLFTVVASATTLTHQGIVSQSGNPLTGDHDVTFGLYADSLGGAPIWSEGYSLTFLQGRFHAQLGRVTPLPQSLLSSIQTFWLETTVEGTTLPRQRLEPSHGAIYADSARVAGGSGSGSNAWSDDGTTLAAARNVVASPKADGWSHQLSAEGSSGKLNLYADPLGAGYITTTTLDKPLYLYGDVAVSDASNNRNIRLNRDGSSLFAGRGQFSSGLRLSADNAEVNGAPFYGLGLSNLQLPEGSGYPAVQLGGYYGLNLQSAGGSLSLRADGAVNISGALGIGPGTPWTTHGIFLDASSQTSQIWWDNRLNTGFRLFQGQGSADFFFACNGGGSLETWNFTSSGMGSLMTIASTITMNRPVTINGSLSVSGTKCREVDTPEFGKLYYNAVESARPVFTVSGRAKLDNGTARVALDPKWMAGVTIDERHQLDVSSIVFYGLHGNWYVTPDQSGFTLTETSGADVEFFWTVQASQKGFEDLYLDRPQTNAVIAKE